MTYGFIGCGNMAGAILYGCLQARFFGADEARVYEKSLERAAYIKANWQVESCGSIEELMNFADVVVLGLKPAVLPSVLPEVRKHTAGKLIISIAGGVSLDSLEAGLGNTAAIVRVMPNLNARVNAGVAAVCANANTPDEQKKLAMDMFGALGKALELPETQFSVFTAVAGCSPAFTYIYIDAMARAAVKLGMNKQQALAAAAQAVLGSAQNLISSGEHPWAMADQVWSPGGSTIEGVLTLQAHGFEAAVAAAIQACVDKDSSVSSH
jgi:pyrroline-5-carboxylate reductase